MESSQEVPIEESEGSVEEIRDKKKALKRKNKKIKTDDMFERLEKNAMA